MPAFSLEPQSVPPVETKFRRIVTQLPVPESVPLLKRLQATEPRAMQGQPPVIWDQAQGFLVRDRWGNQWIDWSSGVLITNAGHNAPFLIGPAGVQRLVTGGLIVGLFPEAQYEQGVVPLHPDDILVTFSDGVSEALSADGEEFGDDRILACIKAAAPNLGPEELVALVIAAVQEFTVGEPQNDDITVLVVRFLGGMATGAAGTLD